MLQVLSSLWKFLLRLMGIRHEAGKAQGDDIVDRLKVEFSSLSFEALQKAQTSLLELAETRFKTLSEAGAADLNQKKSLIDQQLADMRTELGKVSSLVNELEKDREKKFGELTSQLKTVGEQTASLRTTTARAPRSIGQHEGTGAMGRADGRGYTPPYWV